MRTIHDWLKYVEETKRRTRGSDRPPAPPPTGTSAPPTRSEGRTPPRRSTSRETPPSDTRQVPPPVKVERGSKTLPPSVRPVGGEVPAPGKPQRKPRSPERLKQLMSSIDARLQVPLPLPSAPKESQPFRRKRTPFSESRESLVHRLFDPELRLREVALLLSVCPATVRRYANRGTLPYRRTPGNQRRFRLSDVVDFLQSRQAR